MFFQAISQQKKCFLSVYALLDLLYIPAIWESWSPFSNGHLDFLINFPTYFFLYYKQISIWTEHKNREADWQTQLEEARRTFLGDEIEDETSGNSYKNGVFESFYKKRAKGKLWNIMF